MFLKSFLTKISVEYIWVWEWKKMLTPTLNNGKLGCFDVWTVLCVCGEFRYKFSSIFGVRRDGSEKAKKEDGFANEGRQSNTREKEPAIYWSPDRISQIKSIRFQIAVLYPFDSWYIFLNRFFLSLFIKSIYNKNQPNSIMVRVSAICPVDRG